jgi:hypothetical protein
MKPDISLTQLRGLSLTQGHLDDLLEDHEELVDTYLRPGLRLGAEAEAGSGPKVLGVGLTQNEVDGRLTGEPALRLLVDRLDEAAPGAPTHTPRGAPILVEEVGKIIPAGFQTRNRPATGGVSIAPCVTNYAGTLGCLLKSANVKYILSNNHVLADEGVLAAGATIAQQAVMDGGICPGDVIATLSYIVPLVFGGVSAVDAAIAAVGDPDDVDGRIMRSDNVVEQMVAPVTAPVVGMSVQKSGRTTGWTRAARVQDVGVTIAVPYAGGVTTFNNTFTVRRVSGNFASAGDSGSVITTDPSNQPVGLLFAVDAANRLTYANRMSDVLTALGIQTGAEVKVVYV